MAAQKPNFLAYSAPTNTRSDKPWRLIGAAWENNGYISVVLDAFPTPGNSLVLAPPKKADDDGSSAVAPRDRSGNGDHNRRRSRT